MCNSMTPKFYSWIYAKKKFHVDFGRLYKFLAALYKISKTKHKQKTAIINR